MVFWVVFFFSLNKIPKEKASLIQIHSTFLRLAPGKKLSLSQKNPTSNHTSCCGAQRTKILPGSCHKHCRKRTGAQPWAENPDPPQRLENEVLLLALLSGRGWHRACGSSGTRARGQALPQPLLELFHKKWIFFSCWQVHH